MITASIVLYNTDLKFLEKLVSSFDDTILLYLIDNSPNDNLKIVIEKKKSIIYIRNSSNIGFGAAHNIAFKKALNEGSDYHLVVNPDIIFDRSIISVLVSKMENDINIGMIMPKILNVDGSIQFLPKLLPTPISILLRKLKTPKFFYKPFIEKYELRKFSNDVEYNTPVISGCFTLIRLDAIRKVGFYDEKYFMYFEDWDLSRRISVDFKTIYYPFVSVFHLYYSGANKKFKLFIIYIRSYVVYFNKWGWFKDNQRVELNNQTIQQFN